MHADALILVQVLGWFAAFDATWSSHCLAAVVLHRLHRQVKLECNNLRRKSQTEKTSEHLLHGISPVCFTVGPGQCPTSAPTPTFFYSKALTEPKRCPLTFLGYRSASPRSPKRAKNRATGNVQFWNRATCMGCLSTDSAFRFCCNSLESGD